VADNKNKRIRLIFFSFGILEQGGGFEDFLIKTAPELMDLEEIFDTAIITSTPKLTEKLQHLLTFYFFKKHDIKNIYREPTEVIISRLGKVPYIQVTNLKGLFNTLNDYDYVYAKNEILELVIMKLIKRKRKCKLIIGIHTPIYYPYTPSFSAKLHNFIYCSKFYEWLINDASQIKVNTNDDKNLLTDMFGHDNVKVVPHAFQAEGHNQVQNKSKLLRVLFVGRITEQKGIDILVKIIETQRKKNEFKNFVYRVAGSGEPRLEETLKKLAIENANFEYLGHIEHAEVSKLYDWTDVTLVPSKYETLNKTSVETGIAGKIVISSNIPGPRDVIDNNKTGFLLDLSVENFYNKLNDLANTKRKNPSKLYDMGSKAQIKIKQKFNPEKIYSDFYSQILSDR
jgi:glycosyltransferase involved in cell wall biosynthesis